MNIERERCAKIAATHPHHSGLEIAELIREGGEWIDQNYQIDRYGVALMMIREGCADPVGLARRILSEFEASSDAVGPSPHPGAASQPADSVGNLASEDK